MVPSKFHLESMEISLACYLHYFKPSGISYPCFSFPSGWSFCPWAAQPFTNKEHLQAHQVDQP